MDKELTSTSSGVRGARKAKSALLIACVLLWSVSSAIAQQASPDQPQPLPDTPGVAQSANQPSPAQVPLGTAVAPAVPVTGIAVFSPAGAAIAPAKQHRVRTILISVGIVLGTVAAVGTVVALANASPSRPPGAR